MIASYNSSSSLLLLRRSRVFLPSLDKYSSDDNVAAIISYASSSSRTTSSSSHHNATLPLQEQRLTYNRDTGIVSSSSSASSASSSIQQLYQTIIGIEIHAQLSIPTKLFSSAPTRHHHNNGTMSNTTITSASVNTHVHPFDLAYPGTLPSLSHDAIKASILSAAVLKCRNIHHYSKFERKHYFYADLSSGYQITQQRWPLASDGLVTFLPYLNNNQHHQTSSGSAKKKKQKQRRRGRDANNEQEQKNNEVQQLQPQQQPVQLRIERIQLEQDTGKTTTHTIIDNNNNTSTTTLANIDYNRAGCALIEIVSHPDLRSAHEAAGVVETIRKLLKHVGSCDGKMEEGSLRCDLNVSIAPIHHNDNDDDDLISSLKRRDTLPPGNGHRVEVKNLNSLRQIIAATEYEALRQSALALQNTPTGRETRTFHVKPTLPLGGETICIRSKGDAIDYRFMPEPDLPPLILDMTTLDNMSLSEFLTKNKPESAEDATARLVEQYSLVESVAALIANDPPAIEFFEGAVSTARAELEADAIALQHDDVGGSSQVAEDDNISVVSSLVANYLCNDLYALIKKSAVEGLSSSNDEDEKRAALLNSISVEQSTVNDKRLGLLIAMIVKGTITTSMAKKILTIMYNDDITSYPADIAMANGWEVISNMDILTQLCENVVYDPKNSKQLEQYKLGGKNIWKIEKFFVGKIMAQSDGNAHPEKMKKALACVLEKETTS
jgi:aspartyl-tRNA(Asn)/glutamyl-tRNA(Gln) amidotransferase subunit B